MPNNNEDSFTFNIEEVPYKEPNLLKFDSGNTNYSYGDTNRNSS